MSRASVVVVQVRAWAQGIQEGGGLGEERYWTRPWENQGAVSRVEGAGPWLPSSLRAASDGPRLLGTAGGTGLRGEPSSGSLMTAVPSPCHLPPRGAEPSPQAAWPWGCGQDWFHLCSLNPNIWPGGDFEQVVHI